MSAERATLSRAVAAFLALPVVVAGIVPVWILSAGAAGGAQTWLRIVGAIVLAVGLLILLWCVRDFFVSGRGTLAPWDPPRSLVTVGLYRFVRNPMYVGVVTLVLGIALTFGSRAVAWYAGLLATIFHIRVVGFEEPWLARSFPEDWRRYSTAVRRWWPRLKPWE